MFLGEKVSTKVVEISDYNAAFKQSVTQNEIDLTTAHGPIDTNHPSDDIVRTSTEQLQNLNIDLRNASEFQTFNKTSIHHSVVQGASNDPDQIDVNEPEHVVFEFIDQRQGTTSKSNSDYQKLMNKMDYMQKKF